MRYIFSLRSLFCVCFKCCFLFLVFTSVPPSQQEDPIVLSCLASSAGLFQGPAVEEHLSCTAESSGSGLDYLASHCYLEGV